MRVAVIKGHSRYGLLRCFADAVIAAIRARGDAVAVLDLIDFPLPALGAQAEAAGPVDLVLSFNICSDYRDPGGRSLYELTGVPHVIHFVDHPLHHLERLKATPHQTAVLFVDREHPRSAGKLFGPGRFAYCGFCPHGALGEAAPLPGDSAAYLAGRPITALFAGTFYRPDRKQIDQLPEHVRSVFDAAIDIAMGCDGIDAVDAVDEVLLQQGLAPEASLADPDLREGIMIIRGLSYLVDDYVRGHRRVRLIEALVQSGLPLTLVGEGYDGFDGLPRVDYRGQIPTAVIPELMRSARMVFSANANFGFGSHERPLTAMLAGAVAATDFSTFYADSFTPGRDIALLRWTAFDADFAALRTMADDAEALFAMASSGQSAVAGAHRWLHRIETYYAAARAAAAAIASP
jgi:hypothetical protein